MATEEVTKPPSLPPYPEMIMKAIEALGDSNGASKSGISNYIESTYGELPAGYAALLSHHLDKMKDSGELVFSKNNYTKPDPNAPPKRGRGRPPKPKDPNAPPKPPPSTGRPRGRPRKFPRTEVTSSTAPSSTGRPRGRPPKVKPQLATEVASVEQNRVATKLH